MKRHPQDLSEAEVRERLCPACVVKFEDLESLDFPEPAYIANGQKHWAFAAIAPWINGRVRAEIAGTPPARRLADVVQLAFWMRGVPEMSAAEASHLALSAAVDLTVKHVFGYGMRDAVVRVGEDSDED